MISKRAVKERPRNQCSQIIFQTLGLDSLAGRLSYRAKCIVNTGNNLGSNILEKLGKISYHFS